MLKKFFKRKDSLYEIRLIALLLGVGNIAVVINSGMVDISLISFIVEATIVTSAIFFTIKLYKQYRAFVKKKQAA